MAELLIAEDEKNIRDGLEALFTSAGYAVRTVKNGEAALAACAKSLPDLLLLDVMMPKMDGFAVLTELRQKTPFLPVLLLTARAGQDDKLRGLGLGADDYITKPFDSAELLARVARTLTRSTMYAQAGKVENSPAASFAFAGGRIDPLRQEFTDTANRTHTLSPNEVKLLAFFAQHPDEVLDRTTIMRQAWNALYLSTSRTLDQHIANLRHKIGPDVAKCLVTVPCVGYRYHPPKD